MAQHNDFTVGNKTMAGEFPVSNTEFILVISYCKSCKCLITGRSICQLFLMHKSLNSQ